MGDAGNKRLVLMRGLPGSGAFQTCTRQWTDRHHQLTCILRQRPADLSTCHCAACLLDASLLALARIHVLPMLLAPTSREAVSRIVNVMRVRATASPSVLRGEPAYAPLAFLWKSALRCSCKLAAHHSSWCVEGGDVQSSVFTVAPTML
jgi:hypothetical protein